MAARLSCLLLIILGLVAGCSLLETAVDPLPKIGKGEYSEEIAYENGFTGWGKKDNPSHFGKSPHPEEMKVHDNIVMFVIIIITCIFFVVVCILVWKVYKLIQRVRADSIQDVEKTNPEKQDKAEMEVIANMKQLAVDKEEIEKVLYSHEVAKDLMEKIANMKHLAVSLKDIEKELYSEVMNKDLIEVIPNMKHSAVDKEEIEKEMYFEEKEKVLMEALTNMKQLAADIKEMKKEGDSEKMKNVLTESMSLLVKATENL